MISTVMSGARCAICGKKRIVGRNVSHSGVRTPRVFRPNLQWKQVVLGGNKVRIRTCTKCLKRLKKETTASANRVPPKASAVAQATVEKQVSEAPVTSQ